MSAVFRKGAAPESDRDRIRRRIAAILFDWHCGGSSFRPIRSQRLAIHQDYPGRDLLINQVVRGDKNTQRRRS
jgi:hypothetical protein